MRQRISPTGRGFALLEVLMASAILGLAAAVLLGAISQSQSFLDRIGNRRQAAALAETILEEYQLGLVADEGTFEGTPWQWQIVAKKTEVGQELTVIIARSTEKGSYSLTTLAGAGL